MLARIAKRLTSHKGKQHIVAVAVRKGKVIGVGYNSYSKTHPEQARLARGVGQDERIYLHAEIAALLRCRAKPDSLYIARVKRTGELGNAAPCPVCSAAINLINPKMKVIHS